MDNSRNRKNEHLGVNKIGKNIRKSPIHQPNFSNNNGNDPDSNNGGNNDRNASRQQQPQPQVFNINKNNFRSIVQQLTGSPARDWEPLPRPPNNPPKPQSMRLQKIRPPPLTPMSRPRFPPPAAVPVAPPAVPYGNTNFARAAPYGQPSPKSFQTVSLGAPPFVGNTNESPISAYMRYLQTSPVDPASSRNKAPYQLPPQQIILPSASLHLNPHHPTMLPSPRMNDPMLFPPIPNVSSLQMNGGPMPALLPSPTSQFLLPSPSSYLNLQSPRSSYPLLSPGFQLPSPFSFSPMIQPGILGPGPQPPLSPGMLPLSPGFFAMPSPRWRD